MSVDYIVSSLPALFFGLPAPMSWERFLAACGDEGSTSPLPGAAAPLLDKWRDLETQLRNAMAAARIAARSDANAVGNARFMRPAQGCSLYWRNRVTACFGEKDPFRRDEALDRVWWDAAEELIEPQSPLGKGALAAYAIRLAILIKRDGISKTAGNAAFDRLTAETKIDFSDLTSGN